MEHNQLNKVASVCARVFLSSLQGAMNKEAIYNARTFKDTGEIVDVGRKLWLRAFINRAERLGGTFEENRRIQELFSRDKAKGYEAMLPRLLRAKTDPGLAEKIPSMDNRLFYNPLHRRPLHEYTPEMMLRKLLTTNDQGEGTARTLRLVGSESLSPLTRFRMTQYLKEGPESRHFYPRINMFDPPTTWSRS